MGRKFTELLNESLPSAKNSRVYTEEEEILDKMEEELLLNNAPADDEEEDIEDEDIEVDVDDEDEEDDEDEDIEDFNFGDMSDEDFTDLVEDMRDGDLDEEDIDDEDEQATLTPDEEMKADDMMSVAATTMLVKDELNDEEKAEFLDKEADVAVAEGFMTDSDVRELGYDIGLMTEGNNYNKKMIIRLDAESKKKQLFALAVNISAAAHKDSDYKKYKKVMKMKKILRKKMEKKYRSEAMKRMKIYFTRLRRSKSNTLNKIANKGK